MHVYTEQQLKHSGTQNTLKGPQAVRCNTEARKKKKKKYSRQNTWNVTTAKIVIR